MDLLCLILWRLQIIIAKVVLLGLADVRAVLRLRLLHVIAVAVAQLVAELALVDAHGSSSRANMREQTACARWESFDCSSNFSPRIEAVMWRSAAAT